MPFKMKGPTLKQMIKDLNSKEVKKGKAFDKTVPKAVKSPAKVERSPEQLKENRKNMIEEGAKLAKLKARGKKKKGKTGITVGNVVQTVFSGATKIPTEGSKKVRKKVVDVAKKTKKKVWDKAKKVWNYKLVD